MVAPDVFVIKKEGIASVATLQQILSQKKEGIASVAVYVGSRLR